MIRLTMEAKGNYSQGSVDRNCLLAQKYNKVTWGMLTHPPCIVAGGGPSLKERMNYLRDFEGDIFAINDTAGYLSDNGIKCYLYSIDATEIPFHIGENVIGAVLATRCDPVQYSQFPFESIRTFNSAEDDSVDGIEGGPTGVCRTPHLLIKMGYSAIIYLGCEGNFSKESHVGGMRQDALDNMIIIRVNGVDYITNAAFMMQSEYLSEIIRANPTLLVSISGGLLAAMLKYPEGWGVVAIAGGLKKQYDDKGIPLWTTKYSFGEYPLYV